MEGTKLERQRRAVNRQALTLLPADVLLCYDLSFGAPLPFRDSRAGNPISRRSQT
jgi:hypothetical protein